MILRKLALFLALSTMLGIAGCGGRKHVAIPSGATGIYLGDGKYAFPNTKGELEVGPYQGEAGDLVRRPTSREEIVKTLEASGIKLVPSEK